MTDQTAEEHDSQLIDRHLAGVLTPAEEARLEELIRTSPAWNRRYREAEEMARLIHASVDDVRPSDVVKGRIHARLDEVDRRRATERTVRAVARGRRPDVIRNLVPLATAAVLLVAVYLFLPTGGSHFLPTVYAAEPLALKDLARSSDVLLVGRAELANGSLRLRQERTIFGDATGVVVDLPPGLAAGERVAVFGRLAGDGHVQVVGGGRGIVHLDGLQRWEGRTVEPAEARRLLTRTREFRTLESALEDVRSFLTDANATRVVGPEKGRLGFSGAVAARFLGRFDIGRIRETLTALVMSAEKHPAARSAGAEAMVEADPLDTCRMILKSVLSQPVERLHGESEDGLVVLHCLRLIQQNGTADLAEGLDAFTVRVRCPVLRDAGRAAAKAVRGEGPRTPPAETVKRARRINVGDREGIVLPACMGRKDGLVVVFRGHLGLATLRPVVSAAVESGHGVLVLPTHVTDIPAWIRGASETRLVDTSRMSFLGLGDEGTKDAVRAAEVVGPDELVLVGTTDALTRAPARARSLETADVPGALMDVEILKRIFQTK